MQNLFNRRSDKVREYLFVLKMHFEPKANGAQLFQINMMNLKNMQPPNQFSIT